MSDYRSIATTTTTPMSSLNSADPLAAKANTVIAFTDGACKGNPGAGGWGAHLIFSDGRTQDLYGGEGATTNNRMELMGAIKALQYSPIETTLEIWTDSSYVKNGITDWIDGWKKRGWKTASKKPVANQDLWQQLDILRQNRQVEWHWVKGHAGHTGNEKADELANLGVTASSEPASIHPTSPINSDASTDTGTIKKKAPVIEQAVEDNDWLNFDPLGLDDFDDVDFELENELEDDDLPHATTDTVNTNMTDDTNLQRSDTQEVDLPKFDGDTSRANPHFQPLLPKPIHKGERNRQLIMDTETTGLDALKGDRVIEVGIVELIDRKFTGEKLHVYINPQRGMDEEVIRIHGISEAFLTDKPTFDKVAQALYDFMDGAEVIAHNSSFDMNFLNMEFAKVGLADFAERVQVTDSLLMAKQQYPGQKNTLDALVRRLDVGKQDRTFHGALLDSEILAEVYLAMTGGQVSLAIEEDSSSEGGQTAHANYANLAALLLESNNNEEANRQWFKNLATDYPAMNDSLSKW